MGKLIALYGINNTGKSAQTEMLERRLKNLGYRVIRTKYPQYACDPTGPRINAYLRGGNPEKMTPEQFQFLNIQNRLDYESELKQLLAQHDFVIAEDYKGTGIAWGIGAGVNKELLLEKNTVLLDPDAAVLLDGKRFLEGKEEKHAHENDDVLTEKVRLAHLELADHFGWPVVKSDESREIVHENVYACIAQILCL